MPDVSAIYRSEDSHQSCRRFVNAIAVGYSNPGVSISASFLEQGHTDLSKSKRVGFTTNERNMTKRDRLEPAPVKETWSETRRIHGQETQFEGSHTSDSTQIFQGSITCFIHYSHTLEKV